MRERYATLVELERSVFHGVVNGRLNKQLAAEFDTCERTIKAYRARVMSKLQATSLAELVRVAKLLGVSGAAVEQPTVRSRHPAVTYFEDYIRPERRAH